MNESSERLMEVFHDARTHAPGDARDRFVGESCGHDAELRMQVEALLLAHKSAGDLLDLPDLPSPNSISTERPGDLVRHFKWIEKIGEGWFGITKSIIQFGTSEWIPTRCHLRAVKSTQRTRVQRENPG